MEAPLRFLFSRTGLEEAQRQTKKTDTMPAMMRLATRSRCASCTDTGRLTRPRSRAGLGSPAQALRTLCAGSRISMKSALARETSRSRARSQRQSPLGVAE